MNCGADCALINCASKYVSLLIHCTSLFFSGKMDHHVDRLYLPVRSTYLERITRAYTTGNKYYVKIAGEAYYISKWGFKENYQTD